MSTKSRLALTLEARLDPGSVGAAVQGNRVVAHSAILVHLEGQSGSCSILEDQLVILQAAICPALGRLTFFLPMSKGYWAT
jgi:hypothetical protein